VAPVERVVAILGYHKIGEPPAGGWPTWFYVPEATFARHLRWLAGAGWSPLALDTFLAGLEDPSRLPPRGVLLTFDDGYRSVREVALPWLERLGFPAVLFVPSDFVGARNTFDQASEPDEPLCDWDDLRALQRAGVAIEAHGASHRAFSEMDAAAQDDELRRSKAALEAGLGTPVEVFAFPYGDAGPDRPGVARRLSAAGYRAACLYGGGPVGWPAEAYALPRVPVGPDTELAALLGPGSGA